MSRTGLTYGAKDIYEALYFMEADPKALIGPEGGVYLFNYTDEIKKAHEAYEKNPGTAKITLQTAAGNFAKLGASLVVGGATGKRRGPKPGRKRGRPAGSGSTAKPGRPAGKKRGPKPGKKPGRKPGRPKKAGGAKKSAVKLVPPAERAKIDAEVKALVDQKKSRDEIMSTLKSKYGGQAVAGSMRRMNMKKK